MDELGVEEGCLEVHMLHVHTMVHHDWDYEKEWRVKRHRRVRGI